MLISTPQLGGFFDESGSPDEGHVLVVAGFISTEEQCVEFEKDWKAVLDREGISRFHMRDFAHSKREFADWKDDEYRRKTFLSDLLSVVNRHALISISNAIILKAYEELNEKYHLREYLGYPYAIAARGCVAKGNLWAQENGYAQPIRYVFEDGAAHKPSFKKAMKRDEQSDPEFATKDKYYAFQAADLIAWENRKVCTDVETGALTDFRVPLKLLLSMPNDCGVYDKEALEEMIKQLNISERVEAEVVVVVDNQPG